MAPPQLGLYNLEAGAAEHGADQRQPERLCRRHGRAHRPRRLRRHRRPDHPVRARPDERVPAGLIDDEGVRAVQTAMIDHCERNGDRVAILDARPDMKPQQIKEWRMNEARYDSSYAALYYPWIQVADPVTGKTITVPPSGHIAGVWARDDSERGVHKAPANETIRGCIGLEFQTTTEEQTRSIPSASTASAPSPAAASASGAPARSPAIRSGAISTCAACSTSCARASPERHAMGRLRAQRHRSCGSSRARHLVVPDARLQHGRAVRRHGRRSRSSSSATPRPTRPSVIDAGQVICEIGIAPDQAGRVRDLPHQPVLARRRRRRRITG